MNRLCVLVLVLALSYGCKKSGSANSTDNDDNIPAAFTPVGSATGVLATKTIGPGGGTILSADGRIGLNIPAGALSANTNISIQPVTNQCPGGSGAAYDLLPNGTKFAVPATFIFHYADSDVNGTDPYLFYLAYQDSAHEWKVNIYKDVDTVAKTVSFDIDHFTPYSNLAGVRIIADYGKTDLQENEKTTLRLLQFVRTKQLAGETAPGEDELPPIPQSHPVADDLVRSWTVSGGSANGTVTGYGSEATYTAPANIDKDRSVIVSVSTGQNTVIKSRKSKGVITTLNQHVYTIKLNLHPAALSFIVKLETNLSNTSGVYDDKYHDEGTLQVDVKNIQVTVSNFKNQAPTVTPSSGSGGGEKAQWMPDGIGVINVIGGQGVVIPPDSTGYRHVAMTFTHTGTVLPSWLITEPDGSTSTIKGEPVPGGVLSTVFILKDSAQVIDPLKGTAAGGIEVVTVTPIH
jgi:hypothetical protein